MESGIHGCRIQNPQTWNPESTAWNPESKTLLDYLTWDEKESDVAGTFQSISSRSLTWVDENGWGDIDISLGDRRRGRVSSCLRSYKTDTPKYNR